MPKLELPAKEIVDADVTYISLVDRGANRAPFKIVKRDSGDNPMIDLDIFRLFKSEAPPPFLGLVISKSAWNEDLDAKLTEAGIDISRKQEKDGAYVYAQTDNVSESTSVLMKASDRVFVIMSKRAMESVDALIKKADDPATAFFDMISDDGHYAFLSPATDYLRWALMDALDDAGSPADAVAAIQQITASFGAYLSVLMTAIPENVFKAVDLVVPKAHTGLSDKALEVLGFVVKAEPTTAAPQQPTVGDEAQPKDQATEAKSETHPSDAPEGEAGQASKAEGNDAGEAGETAIDPAGSDPAVTGDPAPAPGMAQQAFDSIMAAMATLTEQMAGVQQAVASVKSDQAALVARMDSAEQIATESSQALKTVVGGGAKDEALLGKEGEKKAAGAPDVFDTGLSPSVRKSMASQPAARQRH